MLIHCYDLATIWYVEAFIALYLNRTNRVPSFKVISLGGISGTVVDAKVVNSKILSARLIRLSLPFFHQQPQTLQIIRPVEIVAPVGFIIQFAGILLPEEKGAALFPARIEFEGKGIVLN